MAKPWDELHTKIDSEEAYNEVTAFKGMTVMEIHSGGGIRAERRSFLPTSHS